MRSVALGAYVAGLVAAIVFGVVPFLTKERDMPASITSPPAIEAVSLVELPPRGRVCMDDIAADPRAGQARFKAGSYGKPGPPLTLTVTAEGYRASAAIPAGWADNATLAAAVPSPGKAKLVTACIRNEGRVKIALYAAAERARSRSTTTRDGRLVRATPQFGFWEARPASLADRIGVTVDRMATFRGPLSHAWIVWALLALFLVGMPAALGWLLWRAFE